MMRMCNNWAVVVLACLSHAAAVLYDRRLRRQEAWDDDN